MNDAEKTIVNFLKAIDQIRIQNLAEDAGKSNDAVQASFDYITKLEEFTGACVSPLFELLAGKQVERETLIDLHKKLGEILKVWNRWEGEE